MALVLAGCSGGNQTEMAPASGLQQVLAATAAPFTGHGTWWNPAEPGSGFVFEAQGATGVITYFTYEASGKPVWYSGAGALTLRDDGKHVFGATLYRYAGGQGAASATPRTPTRTEIGTTTVVFDGNSAQVQIPGRSYAAVKFNASTAANGMQPEAGIYWNPAESGRGYTIEVAGNTVSIGIFHYDADGQPTWNLVAGDISSGRLSAAFTSYTGGQPFGGAYRAATASTTTQQFQASFGAACSGQIQFPGMGAIAVSRFPFGGLPAGGECRFANTPAVAACVPTVAQGFARNIETVVADAGYAGGGDGGGGDGGGAGAGGGLGKVLGGLLRVTDLSDGSVVGEAITDSTQGLVTIKTCARPGPFLLTLEGRAGAKYFDEGLGQLTDFGPGNVLHAIVDRWDEHVGVSPLTEAAYRYALNNFKANAAEIAARQAPLRAEGSLAGLTHDQVRQAHALVAGEINKRLTSNFSLPSSKTLPLPIGPESTAAALKDNRYGRSAAVNGGLVQAAWLHNTALAAPALSLVNNLARDLTDGRIDGYALAGSPVAPATQAAYESVRLPIGGNYGSQAVARRFGQALQPGQLGVEEESFVNAQGFFRAQPGYTDCNGFFDDVALLSDGSVTVVRQFPTNVNGTCSFRYDAAEFNARQTIRNFVTGVKALARGAAAVYAIRTDGTVVGWGDNYCGRIAPTLAPGIYKTPQPIDGLRDITAMSNDWSGTVARDRSGGVYFWGIAATSPGNIPPGYTVCDANLTADGQTFDHVRSTAIGKFDISNVADVFAYGKNFFALTTDGNVLGWGTGNFGLLANSDGTLYPSSAGVFPDPWLGGLAVATPTPIPGLGKVRTLAFNAYTAYALLADGTLQAWGSDNGRMLGNGVSRPATRPATVAGLQAITTLAGGFDGLRMIQADGTVLAWGRGEGSLGIGRTLFAPTAFPQPEPVRTILGREGGFTVLTQSGKLVRDVNRTDDLSSQYR